MRIRALAAALLAGVWLLAPLDAKSRPPKVPKHATSPRPKGHKAKRIKPHKVKPPKPQHFRASHPKPLKVPKRKR